MIVFSFDGRDSITPPRRGSRMTHNNGALSCARYAFAPNFFHYCGPDTNGNLGEYIKEQTADVGLSQYLSQFETMYPYLKVIAEANGIKDPLDQKVVEAYWVGNELLNKVKEKMVFEALVDKQKIGKRIGKNEQKWLLTKIDKLAKLHHSFHVLNVFTRTGHHTVSHTVETMDQCLITWGKVGEYRIQNLEYSKNKQPDIGILGYKDIENNKSRVILEPGYQQGDDRIITNNQIPIIKQKPITKQTNHNVIPVKTSTLSLTCLVGRRVRDPGINSDKHNTMTIEGVKLVYVEGKLKLTTGIREVRLPNQEMRQSLKPGDWVSVHWGYVCDKLSKVQVGWLSKLTQFHIDLANETI